MNLMLVLAVTAAIGFLSGLRAFTPIALVSWMAIWGWAPLAGSPLWFIGTTTFAIIVSTVAFGELIADKLPKTPARVMPGPLVARLVTGGLSGGALCFAAGRPWFLGLVLGALGSMGGAFGGYHVRRLLAQQLRIPDVLVALTEDFVTIAGTLLLIWCFFTTPI